MGERKTDAIVLGAGVAGLTAAYELTKRGCTVTVVEAAPFAGGRTSTYVDARGRTVDTGLHVLADHYVNLTEVLAELGMSKKIRWIGKHTYLREGRGSLEWYFSDHKPPLHLVRPMLEMPISLLERAPLLRASLEVAGYGQEDLAELDHVTYFEWHQRRKLGAGFIRELAEAAADAASFLTIREAAARPVLSWLKYLMRNKRAGDVGLFEGTMEECMVEPLRRFIEAHGGEVRLGTAARELVFDGTRITGVRVGRSGARGPCTRADGYVEPAGQGAPEAEVLRADYVVSALPVQMLQRILGAELGAAAGLTDALGLTTTPAISAILWFDRKIFPAPPGAPLVTGCAMRDFVDLATLGRQGGAPGSVYQFVVTRGQEGSDGEIAERLFTDLKRVWPAARDVTLIDWAIEHIGAAMFAAVPGAHAKRPAAETAIGNFFLAGDFTKHDLNASMEGAAFSGRRAAERVLAAKGKPATIVRRIAEPWVTERLRRVRKRAAAVRP
ncbi:FAD-dependent oxidoreductase [Pendulispora albinea]|uniref:FAD-dependent oxidoreductase n=1 Tax=Pendulispora albinea TaxID=2741071 RepID=A0ABZ2LLM6_9BACT